MAEGRYYAAGEYLYFVNDNIVTKEEYVNVERSNGFYNTLGEPKEPATSSFSNSRTGDHGKVEFVPVKEASEQTTEDV